MGSRQGREITLTVACAFVGRYVLDLPDYVQKKSLLRTLTCQAARTVADVPVTVNVNAADHDTADSVYLTVTGLSAESGDDGQVGRGNRVNGLITPYRPMSLEAAAGKNAVTHVGKLYNVMANRIAQAVVKEVSGVEESYCYLLSRIGHPIGDPPLFEVKIILKDPEQFRGLAPRITAVAREAFAGIDALWRESIDGTLQLW